MALEAHSSHFAQPLDKNHRRGLSLEDGIPLISRRPPGPAFPMSDESEESITDEEEPFISASSTASKAASLPINIAESGLEPSSSKATIGSELDFSSIEKNFMELSPSWLLL